MLDGVLVWFRRDLRVADHAALAEALRRGRRVFTAFVFDSEILDALRERADRRVDFIHRSLVDLDAALRARGGGLIVRHGEPVGEILRLARELGVSAVFANRDYEPYAKARDAAVEAGLAGAGIGFELYKDQVVFDGAEVLTQAGRPYTVFTPYKNAWLKRLGEDDVAPQPSESGRLEPSPLATGIPVFEAIGFAPTDLDDIGVAAGMGGAQRRLAAFLPKLSDYAAQRDFPALDGCSGLSVHLRFGTLSIRELVRRALAAGALRGNAGAATWLSELVWREFYFMILDRFPQVAERAFKSEYDGIAWESGKLADERFAAWCAGRTGYPLVDAAMRQLRDTGTMHNRLRMVAASFLCKHLGLDWRRGEAWFAERLLDFDLAANNGGWQWSASSGCDAQPYFRIFNPLNQSQKFDPDGAFIRRFVPELAAVPTARIHAPWEMPGLEQQACGVVIGRDYPAPIVEHAAARQRTLERYAGVRRPAS